MKKIISLFLLYVLILSSCKKEYNNPNAPTETDVFNSPEAMIKVIVGIKNRFAANNLGAASIYQAISASGLTTKELVVQNAGNADLAQLDNGGNNLGPSNGVISSLWTTTNIVNSEAQKLITNSDKIGETNLKNTIRIYGHLYKAMALGTLAAFWEKLPINTGANATFNTRIEALTKAVELLDQASTLLTSTTIPASFLTQVGSEIDLKNTLLALSARYNNMLGNNDQAIAKAASVDLTKKSIFFYNNVNTNPVFRSGITTANVYGIRDNFGLSGTLTPDPNDKRIVFHLTKVTANGSGFFQNDAAPIPIYQPGEMLLVQAEAYARKNDLVNAKKFLDMILTKKPADDAYGVGADLPAYSGTVDQGSLLLEIYKNRCIEMYLSGMKFDDSRRFERPGPGAASPERTRNYYPYPQQERDGNSNTPEDPAG
ncbi:RagB/SusD family nutrient uptake outer membrane protein [Terrimonas pollutisoli]|uniref:RagB/SusD family nutrient uptake outer membrane protein n=1 Tax=Terrimonas pollutisoli TaxID=3034147 RepID=UPI0023EC46FC|nr:RagB/SusD family nutrient uptake outer membrane protein [Terrimonas sp. H1YJ31]